MDELQKHIQESMADPEFQKAWKETEPEYEFNPSDHRPTLEKRTDTARTCPSRRNHSVRDRALLRAAARI